MDIQYKRSEARKLTANEKLIATSGLAGAHEAGSVEQRRSRAGRGTARQKTLPKKASELDEGRHGGRLKPAPTK